MRPSQTTDGRELSDNVFVAPIPHAQFHVRASELKRTKENARMFDRPGHLVLGVRRPVTTSGSTELEFKLHK